MFSTTFFQQAWHLQNCVDQGFPRSGATWNVLVGQVNDRTARCLHPQIWHVSNVYTSLQQASEWGTCGM